MPTSPAPENLAPPTYEDVQAAAERLAGHAIVTPLLESPLLNEKLGGRVLVKAECLQLSGAFKFRGAYNRISRLSDEERQAGVVAFSSGNHAQGVAMVSQMLGVPAVIVMPTDAPEIKLANTRAYGAEVVLYDRETKAARKSGPGWPPNWAQSWSRPMKTPISSPDRARWVWSWRPRPGTWA